MQQFYSSIKTKSKSNLSMGGSSMGSFVAFKPHINQIPPVEQQIKPNNLYDKYNLREKGQKKQKAGPKPQN